MHLVVKTVCPVVRRIRWINYRITLLKSVMSLVTLMAIQVLIVNMKRLSNVWGDCFILVLSSLVMNSLWHWCLCIISIILLYSALEDILKLFQCVLSSPNALPTSQHIVLNEFVTYDAETIIHRCCDTCCQLLPDGSCTQREFRASCAKEATFVEVAIYAQLKERFMGKSLYSKY